MTGLSLYDQFNQVIRNKKSDAKEKARQLEQLFEQARAVENKELIGLTLYFRGLNLLYSQQYRAYQEWLSQYYDYNKEFPSTQNKLFIEKLEVTRLFYQLESILIKRRGEALINSIDIESLKFDEDPLTIEYDFTMTDVADVLNLIGIAERDLGLYDEAIRRFSKALEIYEKAKQTDEIAVIYGNLATVYSSIGDIDSAINYNRRAIDIAKETQSMYGYFHGIANQAGYLLSKSSYEKLPNNKHSVRSKSIRDEVESSLLNTLNDPRIESYPRIQSDILYWLTYLYLDDGNLDKSEVYLERLYKSINNRNEDSYQKQVEELEAYLLVLKDQYSDALDLYVAALDYYLKNNKTDKALSTLRELSWVHERNGDYQQSLEYQKKYADLLSETFNDKRTTILSIEQERNNAKLREKEIMILEEKNRLSELKLTYRNQALAASLVFAVLIILIIWGRLRAKHQLSQQYQKMSYIDALTKIGNRSYLNENIERELARVLRERDRHSEEKLAILAIDIDYFKDLNDNYGHDAGDRVLIEFASRLGHVTRETDLLARWGGEEFIVIGRVKNKHEVAAYTSRVLSEVNKEPYKIRDGLYIQVTCSIGGTIFPFFNTREKEPRWEKLLALADLALYRAKNAGRRQWIVIGNSNIRDVQDLENILNKKLELSNAIELDLVYEMKQQ
ncbi:tetratricopeptide repeat-containing diguanylate cyclase [Pleionea sediminis]|uniref:tetratricopeptide repeat-containing diguanylate cyclase n=1 Tax=Pleionea sediminis TaxID=2569479 RepID=UPI0011867F4B|nr:tetratricopeptide repeat-containing diguanylate cyclase [Pleionea sediminis]